MAIKKKTEEAVTINPPRICVLVQKIVGTAAYVQARFPEKARMMMQAKHEAGSTANKGKTREKRDFDAEFEASMYRGPNDERGIPAAAFRAAFISACRTVNFKMTLAKLGLFVEQDFIDPRDGTGLVEIHGCDDGGAEAKVLPVRNTTGVADLRSRAMWMPGWWATVRVRFDADMFKLEDVINLLSRVGLQVGVGEGRPDSKKSAGMGWGTFKLEGKGHVIEYKADEAA